MKLCVGFLLVSMLLAFNCHAGETWYTHMNQYACNTRADLRDLLKYLEQNDFEAFREKIQTNRCSPIGGCMEVQLMQIYAFYRACSQTGTRWARNRAEGRIQWDEIADVPVACAGNLLFWKRRINFYGSS